MSGTPRPELMRDHQHHWSGASVLPAHVTVYGEEPRTVLLVCGCGALRCVPLPPIEWPPAPRDLGVQESSVS